MLVSLCATVSLVPWLFVPYCAYVMKRAEINNQQLDILVPRDHDPSDLRQESRALGATISGMRHRCRLRETGWAEFGYFLCYFKMVAPRALVFRPLGKGNEDPGNEIGDLIEPRVYQLDMRNSTGSPNFKLEHSRVACSPTADKGKWRLRVREQALMTWWWWRAISS